LNKLILFSILFVSLFLISSCDEYPKDPLLSGGCGECTPWEDGTCGAGECEEWEMKQGRQCYGDYFRDDFRAGQDDPYNSPRYSVGNAPPGCEKRCIANEEECGVVGDRSACSSSFAGSCRLSAEESEYELGCTDWDLCQEYSADHECYVTADTCEVIPGYCECEDFDPVGFCDNEIVDHPDEECAPPDDDNNEYCQQSPIGECDSFGKVGEREDDVGYCNINCLCSYDPVGTPYCNTELCEAADCDANGFGDYTDCESYLGSDYSGELSCNLDTCGIDTTGCVYNPGGSEICDNGVDDDGDDLIDCQEDPDCGDEWFECGWDCFNVMIDEDNCGGCNVPCSVENECINGYCECGENDDCPYGQICNVEEGMCEEDESPECETAEDCDSGESCVDGSCIEDVPPGVCGDGNCDSDESCWDCKADCGIDTDDYYPYDPDGCGIAGWRYNSYGSYGSACEHPTCFIPSSDGNRNGVKKLVDRGIDKYKRTTKVPYYYGWSPYPLNYFWNQYLLSGHINHFDDGLCPDTSDLDDCVSTGDRQFHNFIAWIYVDEEYTKVFDYAVDDSFSINVWNGCGEEVGDFYGARCSLETYKSKTGSGSGIWNIQLTKGWNVIEIMGFNDEGPATYRYSTTPLKDDLHVIAMSSSLPLPYRCDGGTPYGQCSYEHKPWYCTLEGEGVEACYGRDEIVGNEDDCGCSDGGHCTEQGDCT